MIKDMQQSFRELTVIRENILAVSGPLREKRKQLLREYEPKLKRLEDETAVAEAGLYEIDMERGALARALKGKTGETFTVDG